MYVEIKRLLKPSERNACSCSKGGEQRRRGHGTLRLAFPILFGAHLVLAKGSFCKTCDPRRTLIFERASSGKLLMIFCAVAFRFSSSQSACFSKGSKKSIISATGCSKMSTHRLSHFVWEKKFPFVCVRYVAKQTFACKQNARRLGIDVFEMLRKPFEFVQHHC